LAFTAEE
jgi:hypothetical protein